ncbi:MAG: 4Fe-4S binding protein [Candidatus Aminicenantes bacterium]|nr:4Fe-4S binding protein [Candidatus Aminicenantes bacterium]
MAKIKIHTKHEGGWSDARLPLLCLNTGEWRTQRPVVNKEKCTYCGLCALYCTVQCMRDRRDHFQPDLEFCKGCGICAWECPQKAIVMFPEAGFRDEKSE